MLVIHRKGKVLFTWINQELDKWKCLCSVLHMPFYSVFSLFSSSAQDYTSSAHFVSLPSCLFNLYITGIFSWSSYYFSAFSILFHKNWHGRKKPKKILNLRLSFSWEWGVRLWEVSYCFGLFDSIGELNCSFLQLF